VIKPIWAFAGVALLGAASVAVAVIATSSEGEDEVLQQVQTGTTSPVPTAARSAASSPTPSPAATPQSSPDGVQPDRQTYSDPIGGFSFEYPADWFVQGSTPDPAVVAYGVIVSSYNTENARPIEISPPPEEIKIDIGVEPNPDGLTVEEWIAQRLAGPDEGVVTTSEEQVIVDGEPAVRRAVSIQETKVLQHLFGHQGKMYFITAYTADSELIGELDGILASFKLPR
jgi:PsbP-like protein